MNRGPHEHTVILTFSSPCVFIFISISYLFVPSSHTLLLTTSQTDQKSGLVFAASGQLQGLLTAVHKWWMVYNDEVHQDVAELHPWVLELKQEFRSDGVASPLPLLYLMRAWTYRIYEKPPEGPPHVIQKNCYLSYNTYKLFCAFSSCLFLF